MTFSHLATPSATRSVLNAYGLSTKKSLGQHFLIDDNVIGKILELASIDPQETVLEVGPGIGTLTVALLRETKGVVAVERDTDLLPVLHETTASDSEKLALIHKDAVALTPEDLRAAVDGVGLALPKSFVANLPYAVAATLVLQYFEQLESISSATIMVQSEVADRMCAVPGTKSYGSYTIKLRLLARPTGRFQVSRTSFMPPPRVDSAVLRLERAPLSDDPALLLAAATVADAAFAQRRKTIRNSLRSALTTPVEEIDAALAACGIDPICRGETLEPETYLRLAKELLL